MSEHIAQFYACSEVKLACELYYICELGKYSKLNYGKPISIDGVVLNSCLKKSKIWQYFRMACDEGWIIDSGVPQSQLEVSVQTPLDFEKRDVINYLFTINDVNYDSEDMKKRRDSFDYDLRTPVNMQVSFEFMDSRAWKWSINGADGKYFDVNNKAFNHNHADQAWLSLIAFVAVERHYTGSPDILGLVFSTNTVIDVMALSYVMLLKDETQALTGWCHYAFNDSIPESRRLQLGYTAWYAKGRDLGIVNKWYSGLDKYNVIKKLDLQVGDLVMLYERDKAQKNNYIKTINGCYLAKILAVSDETLSLEVIHTVKPYFQGKEDFDNHTIAVKNMYLNDIPYQQLRTTKRDIAMTDVGVGYYLQAEKYFIVPLDCSDDLSITRVSDGKRKDTLLLDQNNLTYWILKDYNYQFNEERFLDKYFKDSVPLYTRYMRGEELEDRYYYKDDEEE